MNITNCSPNIILDGETAGCFTQYELQEMAKAFNRYIVANDLCIKNVCSIKLPINNITNSTADQLWKKLNLRLNKLCYSDHCWVGLPFIKLIENRQLQDKLKHYTFKPAGTKGKYTWLTTDHIDNVLKQYEKLYPNFNFLGALPCDFYKFEDANSYLEGDYDYIGAIFNLDKNDQDGSHWVAFFIDNINKTCEYFDSVGGDPNQCIKKFIKYLLDYKIPGYTYLQNNIVHQRKNSECGVYSIHYIVERLKGKTFNDLSLNVINDDDMHLNRQYFFRTKSII